jgi:hypothetical protein
VRLWILTQESISSVASPSTDLHIHLEIENALDEAYGSAGVGANTVFNSVPQPGTVYRGGLRWGF